MDNGSISEYFSLWAKLMDIHGENSFKAKSYASAAFTIDRLPDPLQQVPAAELSKIKGIGDSTARAITELLTTGKILGLEELIGRTPEGIIEMMRIKGLGPKKIAVIWNELGVESLGELMYACNENRLTLLKGFGEKTQQNILQQIEYYLGNMGKHLYAQVENMTAEMLVWLGKQFPMDRHEVSGAFRRQCDIIECLEWATTAPLAALQSLWEAQGLVTESAEAGVLKMKNANGFPVWFYSTTPASFARTQFLTTASEAWLAKEIGEATVPEAETEAAIFEALQLPWTEPVHREVYPLTKPQQTDALIQPGDVKGIIHSHSNWSDGVHTLPEMAKACIDQGLEYLVISDHSQTAFYANGLKADRIREQHNLIDSLNDGFTNFKIFKSIESDILNDGSLDYPEAVLDTFDLVIASVHSNLKMSPEKAMQRVLTAIQNPYTSILGHMTGRLLLSRPGFPVDHKLIIDACKEYDVVIEINAHPRRLDMDWAWIPYAMEQGVLLSIDPDAHSVEGYKDVKYGVLSAQKGGLTAAANLSSFDRVGMEAFIVRQKNKRKTLSV